MGRITEIQRGRMAEKLNRQMSKRKVGDKEMERNGKMGHEFQRGGLSSRVRQVRS
jgi:hypothetical protein